MCIRDSIPPYFAFQRYNVCWLMPCLRHNSAVPRPASDSFNIPTICSSVNRLFFNFVLLAWPERASLAGELSFTLVQFLGSTSLLLEGFANSLLPSGVTSRPKRTVCRFFVQVVLKANGKLKASLWKNHLLNDASVVAI